jgi:hypothetical protein
MLLYRVDDSLVYAIKDAVSRLQQGGINADAHTVYDCNDGRTRTVGGLLLRLSYRLSHHSRNDTVNVYNPTRYHIISKE